MKISNVKIRNFRGIRSANLDVTETQVLLGDNNTGKTTVLEALDLALGPDRLNRFPPVDEHDFHLGNYMSGNGVSSIGQEISEDNFENFDKIFSTQNEHSIAVLVQLDGMSDEQQSVFGGPSEFYSKSKGRTLKNEEIDNVDDTDVVHCLRILFLGHYDEDTDDFLGKTYYYSELMASRAVVVQKKEKQLIGFLYLRSLRTGSRALSLERGSLLDIVLRAREVKPKMWEDVLERLDDAKIPIDETDEIGLVLSDVQSAINRYVPKEWGAAPKLKVTRMTREDLRRTVVAFVETKDQHSAPYFRQGTGTTNMLVLALLSIIRDSKQNVIFAMEEPETAVPPNVQKQIVNEVVQNSDQALFTSHSPFVIEEFSLDDISVLAIKASSKLKQHTIRIGDASSYNYHQYFRTQLCEGLLARRVIVCEGATEVSIVSGLSRHLAEINPTKYADLSALGYCLINSQTDSQIVNHASALAGLGKHISVFCDAQSKGERAAIVNVADQAFIHDYKRIEDLLISGISEEAKQRFGVGFAWPQYVLDQYNDPAEDIDGALRRYLKKTKGSGGAMILLSTCLEHEVPEFLRSMIRSLTSAVRPELSEATEE